MANTLYYNVYDCDTAGSIICKNPGGLWIRKIVLEPNAAGDSAVLNVWDESAAYAEGAGTYVLNSAIAATISGTTTFTMASGTVLPNTVLDGDVFHILSSDGSTANVGTKSVITTAGNNTVIVATNAGWTAEVGKYYRFKTYPARPFVKLISQATTLQEVERDFGTKGFWVPNLTLETLSSSAKVKIYLR